MKKIKIFIIYLLSLLYMEILFKLLVVHNFHISFISTLLFIFFISIILSIITCLFKSEKKNKIIYFIILTIISIWFTASFVLKSYFGIYLSLDAFSLSDQLKSFAFKGLVEVLRRILFIILFLLPLIGSIIWQKHIDFKQNTKKNIIILIILLCVSYLLYFTSLRINKKETYSSYNLYYKINDQTLNVENFGVVNAFFIDLKRHIFGFNEELILENPEIKEDDKTPQDKTYPYNNLDIDFAKLESEENNSSIKQIHKYMQNETGTLQNEYTGFFKDKNLILFMAESFNEIAVREDITPTLYRLVHSGFSFNNFYIFNFISFVS